MTFLSQRSIFFLNLFYFLCFCFCFCFINCTISLFASQEEVDFSNKHPSYSTISCFTDKKFEDYRNQFNRLLSQETSEDISSLQKIFKECADDQERQQLIDLMEKLTSTFQNNHPRQFRQIFEDLIEIPRDQRENFTSFLITLAKRDLSPVIDDLSYHLSSIDQKLFSLLKSLSSVLLRKYIIENTFQNHHSDLEQSYKLNQRRQYQENYISVLEFLDENASLNSSLLISQMMKIIECSKNIMPLGPICDIFKIMEPNSFKQRTNCFLKLCKINPPFFSNDILIHLKQFDECSDAEVSALTRSTRKFVRLLRVKDNFYTMSTILNVLADYNDDHHLAASQILKNIRKKIPNFTLNVNLLRYFMESKSRGYDYVRYEDIEDYLIWIHKTNPNNLFNFKILKSKFETFLQVPDREYDQFFDNLRKKHNRLKRHSK